MKKTNGLNRFIFIFLAVMLFFTLFSQNLYHQTLPKVVITNMKTKSFDERVSLKDGSYYKTRVKYKVIPKALLDENSIFILEQTEEGFFVAQRELVLGKEFGEWVEVTDGISTRDRLVHGSDRTLVEGMKAIILEEKK